MTEVSQKLLQLADLLELTANKYDRHATLLSEHLAVEDRTIFDRWRATNEQMRVTANRIRAGEFS